MSISSAKTRTHFWITAAKMVFMEDWKVDGAHVKPKGITQNSKCP
jgi:hypothetical protein